MKTRSQQYSQQVFEQLSGLNFEAEVRVRAQPNTLTDAEVSVKNAELKKQYGSLCHKFPLMVLRSGLAQATAFVWVKSKNNESAPYGVFLSNLSRLTKGPVDESPAAFQQRVNGLNLAQYQRMTREVLAAAIWYKRFAESLLDVSGDSNDD